MEAAKSVPVAAPEPGADTIDAPQATSTAPVLSVLVTAHQRRTFLVDAVRSASQQTLPREQYEIVVIKDFEEPEIDRALLRLGARLVRHQSDSMGEIMAEGVRACRGGIISFLDDDDTFEPEKLAVVRREFAHDHDLSYLHNGLVLIDEEGQPTDGRRTRVGMQASAMSADWGFCSSCISIRRTLLDPVIDRWPDVRRSPDSFLDYVSRASRYSRRQTNTPLTKYRVHPASNSMRTNPAKAYLATARILTELPPSRRRRAAMASLLGRYMSAAVRGRSSDRESMVWAMAHLALSAAPAAVRPDAREILFGCVVPFSPALAAGLYSWIRKGRVEWLPPA